MIKKALFSALTMLFCTEIFAQQESQYTQYMYNTMLFNPAYTGSREVGSLFGMFRTQWKHQLSPAYGEFAQCRFGR